MYMCTILPVYLFIIFHHVWEACFLHIMDYGTYSIYDFYIDSAKDSDVLPSLLVENILYMYIRTQHSMNFMVQENSLASVRVISMRRGSLLA